MPIPSICISTCTHENAPIPKTDNFAMPFEPTQNDRAQIALQRIACDLSRNAVQFLFESDGVSRTAREEREREREAPSRQ